MKSRMAMALAVIMGLVAVFGMQLYLKKQKDIIKLGRVQVEIIEASREIIKGDLIERDMFRTTELAESIVIGFDQKVVEAVHADNYVGRVASQDIPEGSVILEYHFEDKSLAAKVNFTPETGQRAITIPVNEVTGVAGALKKGCYVDVIASYRVKNPTYQFAVCLAQVKRVLGVGHVWQTESRLALGALGGVENYKSVTIQVTPQEANSLIHAIQFGILTLVLRDEEDLRVKTDLVGVDTTDQLIKA
ncbi:Flp pilus assembly protein CpaB, partial [bacterium AH-315-F18]|nr:Flp pilus assembly protein CpaB [bacterium AH-315-F18]